MTGPPVPPPLHFLKGNLGLLEGHGGGAGAVWRSGAWPVSELQLSSSEDPLLAGGGGGTDASAAAGIEGGTEAAKAAVLANDGTSGGTTPPD